MKTERNWTNTINNFLSDNASALLAPYLSDENWKTELFEIIDHLACYGLMYGIPPGPTLYVLVEELSQGNTDSPIKILEQLIKSTVESAGEEFISIKEALGHEKTDATSN